MLQDKTPEYMPPKDRVSRLVYNRALSALDEHLVIPSAPNSHYKNRDIIESLVHLSIEERYAESGLEDLATTRPENTPSADTLLYRLKKFRIRNSREEEASFGLMIYRKRDAKETDPIPDQYIVFATNMKYSDARKLYRKIPLEYKKRWGIESGFRVQKTVKAMTTSQNYTIRIVYQMLSIIIYNLWQLANILFAVELKVKLENPLVKLTHLARIFRSSIEMPSGPPQ